MISELETMKESFLEQAKDLNKYRELISSLSPDEIDNELEVLDIAISECLPSEQEALKQLEKIINEVKGMVITVNDKCLELLEKYEIEEDESLTDLISRLDDDANLLLMQGYTAKEAIQIQVNKFKVHLLITYFE